MCHIDVKVGNDANIFNIYKNKMTFKLAFVAGLCAYFSIPFFVIFRLFSLVLYLFNFQFYFLPLFLLNFIQISAEFEPHYAVLIPTWCLHELWMVLALISGTWCNRGSGVSEDGYRWWRWWSWRHGAGAQISHPWLFFSGVPTSNINFTKSFHQKIARNQQDLNEAKL